MARAAARTTAVATAWPQRELFNDGGELSIPGFELLKVDAVRRLDEALAHYNERRRACKNPFCRRERATRRLRTAGERSGLAERAVVALADAVLAEPRQHLNRLSDLLFVLARVLNRANLDGLGGAT